MSLSSSGHLNSGHSIDTMNTEATLPVVIDELYLLVGAVVRVAVVDEDVEAVPLGAHVDEEGDGVPHVDRARDPVAGEAVARADLHEALGRGEGEHHGVRRVGSDTARALQPTPTPSGDRGARGGGGCQNVLLNVKMNLKLNYNQIKCGHKYQTGENKRVQSKRTGGEEEFYNGTQ